MFTQAFLAVIPPILVIMVAMLTRRVRLALITGIVSASIIATKWSVIQSASLITCTFFKVITTPSNLYTFCFLILLGVLIRFMTHSGGIKALTQKILKYLNSITHVQSMTLCISFLFPLDEYLSNLTVGCIMNPLFDKFHTSRAKLAYLLNATAAPLCVLIPLSSWTALLITLFEQSGIKLSANATIHASAFSVYLKTIPFMLYPILSIAATWFIVRLSLSFGAMKKIENNSNKQQTTTAPTQTQATGSIMSFFLPMIIFIVSLLVLLVYTGIRSTNTGDCITLISILQNMKPQIALFCASLIACIATSIYFMSHYIMTVKNIANESICGLCEMLAPISVLLLAWIFSDIINIQLHAGTYIAGALLNNGLPLFIIPAVLFTIALILSASTGTSWGTLMILTPLAIPLVIQTASLALITNFNALLLPALGSIISGSVAGGHLSPFHDLVILASTSTKIDPLLHLKTMIPYVAAPIVGSLSGFLCAGYLALHNFTTPNICMLSIAVGLFVTAGLLTLFNKIL